MKNIYKFFGSIKNETCKAARERETHSFDCMCFIVVAQTMTTVKLFLYAVEIFYATLVKFNAIKFQFEL